MKIKLLLIGTPRQPTLNVGSNGLGRHTYHFLNKFYDKNVYDITTLLHKDSILEWQNIRQMPFYDEYTQHENIKNFILSEKFDVVLDFSHLHILSAVYKNDNLPIINFIHDEECTYMPPNCMLGNHCQKNKYKDGRVFITGIEVNNYNLYETKEDYYSFCGKLEHRKGYDIANYLSKLTGIRTIFAGPDVDRQANTLPEWIGEITNHKIFCDFVGKSTALFYPSRADAGGIGILEAAALGTPTITTGASGARCNVVHGVTGFVINNDSEGIEAIKNVKHLDPKNIRRVCEEKWDFNKNFEKIHQQIVSFYNGERW